MSSFVEEVIPLLFDKYILCYGSESNGSIEENLLRLNFPVYFNRLEKEKAIKLSYSKLPDNPDAVSELIISNKLFDVQNIIKEINNGHIDLIIDILSSDKDCYAESDVSSMRELSEALRNAPDKGRVELVKGVFSKGEEKYICPCGHKNTSGEEFCQTFDCNLNIKGLTIRQVAKIETYKTKVQTLEKLLQSQIVI